jgi:hypothetical protein
MARRRKKLGICQICGIDGELSFEHVPPRSAFNNHPVFVPHFNALIENLDLDFRKVKGKIYQLGAGAHTLCEKCNSITGAWYGDAFIDWAYQAARILKYTEGKASLYYQFRIFPLRVIKQIVCMFFSANGPNFREAHPDLVKFVLNKETKYIKPEIRIYTYYNLTGYSRQSGVAGLIKVNENRYHIYSEIAFFPLGYLMTLESEVPDNRPVDISFFANYSYNDWKEFSLRLPVLPINTYLPGDYRNREQVLNDVAKNIMEEKELKRKKRLIGGS